jgi:hypothetical protein
VFHLLRAILGLDADAHNRTLFLDPELPPWLPDITVHNLRVGNATVTLRFWKEKEGTRYDVLSSSNGLKVTHSAEKEVVC